MNKPTYTLLEITEYLKGKYEMNNTDHCYIISETVHKITLEFKEKKHGLRRWLKPLAAPNDIKKKALAYA